MVLPDNYDCCWGVIVKYLMRQMVRQWLLSYKHVVGVDSTFFAVI
jgi:hypothetical protein